MSGVRESNSGSPRNFQCLLCWLLKIWKTVCIMAMVNCDQMEIWVTNYFGQRRVLVLWIRFGEIQVRIFSILERDTLHIQGRCLHLKQPTTWLGKWGAPSYNVQRTPKRIGMLSNCWLWRYQQFHPVRIHFHISFWSDYNTILIGSSFIQLTWGGSNKLTYDYVQYVLE